MRPSAAFLDRDGTLNVKAPEAQYITSADELEMLPGAAAAVARLNAAGIPVFLITNQRGIARGVMTQEDVDSVHERLAAELEAEGARLDGVYVCPHGYDECDCRKPLPGLLLQAAQEHPDIDLETSLVIGDAASDALAAAAAGAGGILVGPDAKATAEAAGIPLLGVHDSLAEAVDAVLAAPPRTASDSAFALRTTIAAACAVFLALGIVIGVIVASPVDPGIPPVPPPAGASPTPSATLDLKGFAAIPAFASGNIWSQRVDTLSRLDPASQAVVANVNAQVRTDEQNRTGPWINTKQYSVPIYDVGPDQKRVPVVLDVDAPYAASLKASFADGVPVPADAVPSPGTDQHLVVYQAATDTMWEFWHMHRAGGQWHAEWGGTMPKVSHNPGYFNGETRLWGATATSLPLIGGLITPAELAAGRVDHALALALPKTLKGKWTFPAQRTDGFVEEPGAVPEGARFRLDPDLDLEKMNLPRLTLILARAAQRYGIIVRDKSGVVTFYAQDPGPAGNDPYPQLFGGQIPSVPLAQFPWKNLQLLPTELHTFG